MVIEQADIRWVLFCSPEHKKLRLSYCDHSPSVGYPFTFPCLHSNIYKCLPISTKLGQNIYEHKIVILSSNDLKFGMLICCNIWKVSAQELQLYLVLSLCYFPLNVIFTALMPVWNTTLSSQVRTTSNLVCIFVTILVLYVRTITLDSAKFE